MGIRIRPIKQILTARAGLVMVNQLMRHHAQLPQLLDTRFPMRAGFSDSAVAMSYIALLCQGITHFDAVENLRRDPSFGLALGLPELPSSPTVRQRIEARGQAWIESLVEANGRLLARAGVRPTPLSSGHVPLDVDVFVMDNSDSHKEGVGRTYAGVDGYAPIAAYLGREGYLLELALREGTQHSARETDYLLERVVPLARRLVSAPILVRMDAGFCSQRLFEALRAARAECGAVDWIVKWNPRGYDALATHARLAADAACAWTSHRPGKRQTVWRETVGGQIRVMRLTEETIDRHGQSLLLPRIEIEGWWTTLATRSDAEIIALYADHGTHEQFHAELKSEMGLERLPSGKFDANDAVLRLATLAYNILRLLGQASLTGPDSPVRHPAERRRLKTIIRELICAPGQWVRHARQTLLGLPQAWAGCKAFLALLDQPWYRLAPA